MRNKICVPAYANKRRESIGATSVSNRFTLTGLVLVSVAIGLGLGEICLRVFAPFAAMPMSKSFPRFRIDGNPAFCLGYFTSHRSLPFALKPSFYHTVVDRAHHPQPWTVSLDENGYRNPSLNGPYDIVFVGDSVTFGYGVNDNETIAHYASRTTRAYSLAIPNAGPAMYMGMIQDFLKHTTTKKLAVVYFQNDSQNLQNAWWKCATECLPPGDGPISRMDVPAPPRHPPSIAFYPVFRDSHFFALLYRSLIDTGLARPDASKLPETFRRVSRDALIDIENHNDLESRRQQALSMAISQLRQLADAQCTDAFGRVKINDIILALAKGDYVGISDQTAGLISEYVQRDCYPLDDKKVGMLPNVASLAGLHIERLSAVADGYDGNVRNFISLLDIIEETRPTAKPLRAHLMRGITEGLFDGTWIRERTEEIYDELRNEAPVQALEAGTCDKTEIFLNYLQSLQLTGIDVTIFVLPYEASLRSHGISICDRSESHGLKCIDLAPEILDRYRSDPHRSIYLDGAHFNAGGNRFLSQAMLHHSFP